MRNALSGKTPAWTWERIQQAREEYDAFRLAVSSGDDRPLHQFLWHVTIDAQPEALPFHRVYRPWQWERIKRRAPAVEAACGRRKDYTGPRGFWETWPRGHDKTGETARMCVWAAAFAARAVSGTVAASDKDQAGHILKAASRTVELNPWLAKYVSVQANRIVGTMGVIQVTAYDAAGAYGLTDDITICDELTWWKGRDLFDTLLSGMPKRSDGVFLITTNAGIKDSWQEKVLDEFRRTPEMWSVYESPEGEILADWMNREYVESFRRIMSPGVFSRVWENRWVDSAESPLLLLDDIMACEGDCLWGTRPESFAYRPELYMGIDIGRTHDLTVIWTIEVNTIQGRQVAFTREVVSLENCPFHVQRREIEKRLTRDVVRCLIDQGSIGYELAEDFHRHYPHQVERVSLSSGKQGQLAVRVKEAFRGRTVMIPRDEGIRSAFQKIQAVETSPGGLPIIRTPRDASGHCDEFWAFAMALGGMPTRPMAQPTSLPVAVRSRHATRA